MTVRGEISLAIDRPGLRMLHRPSGSRPLTRREHGEGRRSPLPGTGHMGIDQADARPVAAARTASRSSLRGAAG